MTQVSKYKKENDSAYVIVTFILNSNTSNAAKIFKQTPKGRTKGLGTSDWIAQPLKKYQSDQGW